MSSSDIPGVDAAFRRRRALNWVPLGVTYALLYTARYNFSVANVSIACERHWGFAEITRFVSVGLAVYGFSTFFNGPLADRIGGRRAILIAVVGAAVCNLAFAFGAGTAGIVPLLVLWGLNNYFQSFGALSVVKVNTAWFHIRERGNFSGIFGTMIQSGRWIILSLGGFLLAALGWRSLYVLPALALVAIFAVDYLLVRDAPEDAGLPVLDTGTELSSPSDPPATLRYVLQKIFASPIAWAIAGANFCTGFVRHGIEQYWRVFFDNVYHLGTTSLPYQLVANGGFVAGVIGAMSAGDVSDRFFGSRRGPVAAIWYAGQTVLLVLFSFLVPAVSVMHRARSLHCASTGSSSAGTLAVFLSVTAGFVLVNFVVAASRGPLKLGWYAVQMAVIIVLALAGRHLVPANVAPAMAATGILVLLQFLIGGAHGLLAGTASMDYGGRRAAATAAGFFDGVQYLAGAVAGQLFTLTLGRHGWSWWIPSIAPFALGGMILMVTIWRSVPAREIPTTH